MELLVLLLLDPGQHFAETLVLDDGRVADALQMVEDGVGIRWSARLTWPRATWYGSLPNSDSRPSPEHVSRSARSPRKKASSMGSSECLISGEQRKTFARSELFRF